MPMPQHQTTASCYLSPWRNLHRRANADSPCLTKLEITPLANSNHSRDGTHRACLISQSHDVPNPLLQNAQALKKIIKPGQWLQTRRSQSGERRVTQSDRMGIPQTQKPRSQLRY